MERLLDLGVDGIMTDRPKVLREVLERSAVSGRRERPADPVDFLTERDGSSPDASVLSTEMFEYTYSEFAQRCDRLASCSHTTSESGPAIGSHGCAATRTRCSRRITACCSPVPCSCR